MKKTKEQKEAEKSAGPIKSWISQNERNAFIKGYLTSLSKANLETKNIK